MYLISLIVSLFLYVVFLVQSCFKKLKSLSRCRCRNRMNGKTALVIGASSRIGFRTSVELACRGARVIITCRNIAKGIVAQKRIITASGNPHICRRQLDLTSFDSIRAFASEILMTEPHIDVLVNCAGTANAGNLLSEDGVVMEAQINYYGPFLVTMLLVDLMKISAPSRIINVTSSLHRFGKINPATFDQPARGYWARKRMFADCKLATILFTMKLSRMLEGSGVTVNCFSPGMVYTNLWSADSMLGRLMVRLMLPTPVDGAQTAVHLAVARSLKAVTGRYFSNCLAVIPSPRALDTNLAERLWRATERVVGLRRTGFNA